jgi:hypothetical protein
LAVVVAVEETGWCPSRLHEAAAVRVHVAGALACRCVLLGDAHLVPQAAVEVEVVAVGLAGGGVTDVGV